MRRARTLSSGHVAATLSAIESGVAIVALVSAPTATAGGSGRFRGGGGRVRLGASPGGGNVCARVGGLAATESVKARAPQTISPAIRYRRAPLRARLKV